MKKKIKIEHNGVVKIIPITEAFHTQYRILNEMADIFMEESGFVNIPDEYKGLPFKDMPPAIYEQVMKEEKVDAAFEKMTNEYEDELEKIINKAFKTKVNRDNFVSESYIPSDADKENGIVMYEITNDK